MYEPTYLGEIELSEETLTHYGIKGMKWRNRKGRSKNVDASGKHFILGYRGDGQMDWADKKLKGLSSKPRSRQRNITGSGTGAYRKGSGLGSGSSRSNSVSRGVSQVTGGNGSIPGLTLGGISQVTSPRRKKKKKR